MKFTNIRKTKKLSSTVKSVLSRSEVDSRLTPVEILFAYADDLIGIATTENNIALNLQYDTVQNLPKALILYGEVQIHKKEKTATEARVSIAKALSAYLYLLAANCHDMSIEAYALSSDDRKKLPVATFSGGLSFLVGDKTKIDFYDVCREAINAFADEGGGETTTLFPELIVVSYHLATKVDLFEKGFNNPLFFK